MNSYWGLQTAEKGLYSLRIQRYVYAVNIYLNVLVTEETACHGTLIPSSNNAF